MPPEPDHQPAGPVAAPAPTQPVEPGTAEELDVRTLPHGERHEVIFGRLRALEPGGTFVIRNDHDPRPLRYQTESLWPGAFEWGYLEAGPEIWRVAITRAH